MIVQRALLKFRMWAFLGNGYKRAQYAKKKGLYAEIGEKVKLPINVPLFPQLVKIRNNVIMHKSVRMVTHDYINKFLGSLPDSYQYKHNELLCLF